MRKNLSVEELGDLLERPFNATLATYRRDGTVLLSPVWHEWRDAGFSIVTGVGDIKLRHIEQRGQAVAVVADNDPPFRGIEDTFRRIAVRYLGPEQAKAYVDQLVDAMVIIRLAPGRLRAWDFADDYALSAQIAG